MTFTRFSVEPTVPTFQVSGSRSSVIHSCRKYWNKAPTVPVVPASSSLTPVSTCGTGRKAVARIPAHRHAYVPPGISGSSSPVPAYSGSSPESRYQGCFKITNYCLWIEIDPKAAALFIKAWKINPYVPISLPVHQQ
ncbi:hypothetical protein T06_5262 [Trichinella sp. T6]|nr:hypothetical protein T06_5262 [Trichinella sp. T6]